MEVLSVSIIVYGCVKFVSDHKMLWPAQWVLPGKYYAEIFFFLQELKLRKSAVCPWRIFRKLGVLSANTSVYLYTPENNCGLLRKECMFEWRTTLPFPLPCLLTIHYTTQYTSWLTHLQSSGPAQAECGMYMVYVGVLWGPAQNWSNTKVFEF